MKKSIFVLFFSGLISSLFVMGYYLENNKVKKISNNISINQNEEIIGDIESVDESNEKVIIKGWALERNGNNEYFNWVSGKGEDVYINNKIVLIDEDENIFEIKTIAVENKQANEKADDGLNHKKCGVTASVKLSKLNKEQNYTIGIVLTNINGEEILIKSDKEIRNCI